MTLVLCLMSCKEDDTDLAPIVIRRCNVPSTEVFVQGGLVSSYETRSHGYGDKWPKVNVEEGWEAARFSIRIDGKIPGIHNQPSTQYWGGFSGPNLGKVAIDFPYGHYDDRGFDYYKVDKETGQNVGLFRYVFDADGIATTAAILEYPDMREVLTRLKENSTSSKDKAMLEEVLTSEQPLKIIWYVVKEVGMKNGWHVNGVLTHDTVTNVLDIPTIGPLIQDDIDEYQFEESDGDPTKIKDGVEVDIHMQEHSDWNEIKTSIHVREDAGDITVNIPIDYSNIVEQDDFAIRYFHYYYKEFDIITIIEHNENGITITLKGIEAEFINSLKTKYGDGLTIEVHSYCKQAESAWADVKKSTVTTEKEVDVDGQITSAYKPDDIALIGEEE